MVGGCVPEAILLNLASIPYFKPRGPKSAREALMLSELFSTLDSSLLILIFVIFISFFSS